MTLSPPSFCKRYGSSYETPSSSASPTSSPTLPLRKRYRGTSEPIIDTKTKGEESEAECTDSESEESKDDDPGSRSQEAASEDQQQSVPDQQIADETPTHRLHVCTTWEDPKDNTIPSSPRWSLEPLSDTPVIPSLIVSLVTTAAVDEVLALEAWTGHSDSQRAALWQARYEDQREIHDLRMQRVADHRELQELRERVTILERRFGH
ncbi:hypothetical protein Tco_1201227 [Tanacetum coccineum]